MDFIDVYRSFWREMKVRMGGKVCWEPCKINVSCKWGKERGRVRKTQGVVIVDLDFFSFF